ncbi:S26 family signal peptidase [Haloplanus salilacus]|uniref:S26 family signal peptidase n=1 Tax=Haloplanus salilacus TaxID=2949994 RepID=UPI0030CF5323
MSEDDGPRSPGGSDPVDADRFDDDSPPVDDDQSPDGSEPVDEGRPADDPRRIDADRSDDDRRGRDGPLRRVLAAESGALLVLRETAVSVGAVVAVGLLLFAISGVWPPMVAVESGSMEPHMQKGDLVFMTEPGRFAGDAAHEGTGVVTRETARQGDHWKFGAPGSVIVYDDPGSAGPPVIHRAQFWVEEGENWYDRANPDYVAASDCEEMRNCPAPNDGFVTKGDANGRYDQVNGISEPVEPGWIVGIARVRIPYLGWVRLSVSSLALDSPSVASTTLEGETGTGLGDAGSGPVGERESWNASIGSGRMGVIPRITTTPPTA